MHIGGKTFGVDSNQEEVLIRWLEANGFHDKWRRPELGIQSGVFRYTPDIEMSVAVENGMTTRAIVESKPTLEHLSPDAKSRIRKTAKFYSTNLVLLYVHDSRMWYRVDIKTGALLHYGVPKPGDILIDDLFIPKTRYGSKAFDHEYRQRRELGKRIVTSVAELAAKSLGFFTDTILPPPRHKKRSRRHRQKFKR